MHATHSRSGGAHPVQEDAREAGDGSPTEVEDQEAPPPKCGLDERGNCH